MNLSRNVTEVIGSSSPAGWILAEGCAGCFSGLQPWLSWGLKVMVILIPHGSGPLHWSVGSFSGQDQVLILRATLWGRQDGCYFNPSLLVRENRLRETQETCPRSWKELAVEQGPEPRSVTPRPVLFGVPLKAKSDLMNENQYADWLPHPTPHPRLGQSLPACLDEGCLLEGKGSAQLTLSPWLQGCSLADAPDSLWSETKSVEKKQNKTPASPWALMREVKVHNLSLSCLLGTDILWLAGVLPLLWGAPNRNTKTWPTVGECCRACLQWRALNPHGPGMGVIVLMCESAYSGTPALGPQSYARPCFPQDSLFQEGCGWLDWPLEAWLPCLPPSPEGRRAGLGGHSQWHVWRGRGGYSRRLRLFSRLLRATQWLLAGVLETFSLSRIFFFFFCKVSNILAPLPLQTWRKRSFSFLFFVKE